MPKHQDKPIALKLNGQPLQLKESSPSLDKFVAYLEQLPDDELFDVNGLEARGHYKIERIRHFVQRNRERMAPYYCEVGVKRRWHIGNPRAIGALKREIQRKEEETLGGAA